MSFIEYERKQAVDDARAVADLPPGTNQPPPQATSPEAGIADLSDDKGTHSFWRCAGDRRAAVAIAYVLASANVNVARREDQHPGRTRRGRVLLEERACTDEAALLKLEQALYDPNGAVRRTDFRSGHSSGISTPGNNTLVNPQGAHVAHAHRVQNAVG